MKATCDMGLCWQPPGGGGFQFRMSVPEGAVGSDVLLRVWEVSKGGSLSYVLEYPLRRLG